MIREIALDTETTGLKPEDGHRIVELGCLELLNHMPTGRTLHFYFDPERPMDPDATRVSGITDEMLRGKPFFADLAQPFLDFIADAPLVIHNAAFDMGFLEMEFARLKRAPLAQQVGSVLDTLALARELYPGKRNSLDALCDRLEVDRSGRTLHGALLDAQLLADVYIQMTRGQESLLGAENVKSASQAVTVQACDLSAFILPMPVADETELAAHHAILADIDKASGGKTVWRSALEEQESVP